MASIPKIVSTPLKWVSKTVLNQTLFRFPGGDAQDPIACVYCPEMCRFACPTAVVSGNDAVTPCNKMGLLYKERKWPELIHSQNASLWPIYDCTGCGRCTEYCAYGMPVADQLFEARKRLAWSEAQEVSAKISDEMDPVGDLADELGDSAVSQRRKTAFIGSRVERDFLEPKEHFFLGKSGYRGRPFWEKWKNGEVPVKVKERLSTGKWLWHESVWLSRRLKEAKASDAIFSLLKNSGVQVELPFMNGEDCMDCGGEGAYRYLFQGQARDMALEVWYRDKHRVDGVLCLSARCAQHIRASVGEKIPVVALAEIWR